MGIDVRIAFRLAPGASVPKMAWSDQEHLVDYGDLIEEATHELASFRRYYSPGYARGGWPQICAILLDLMASDGVEKVWYGGDSDVGLTECTLAFINEMNAYWIANRDRPYRERR